MCVRFSSAMLIHSGRSLIFYAPATVTSFSYQYHLHTVSFECQQLFMSMMFKFKRRPSEWFSKQNIYFWITLQNPNNSSYLFKWNVRPFWIWNSPSKRICPKFSTYHRHHVEFVIYNVCWVLDATGWLYVVEANRIECRSNSLHSAQLWLLLWVSHLIRFNWILWCERWVCRTQFLFSFNCIQLIQSGPFEWLKSVHSRSRVPFNSCVHFLSPKPPLETAHGAHSAHMQQ